VHTSTLNVAVAGAFAVMAGFVFYLANTGTMTGGPGFQVAIGRFLSRVFVRVEGWTSGVPEIVLGGVLLAGAAALVLVTLRDRRPSLVEPQGATPSCHGHEELAAPSGRSAR
jgi:hypothetical protein